MPKHLVKLLAVEFHPFPPQIYKPSGRGLDLLPLPRGQLFAIQREVCTEGEHRVNPYAGGLARVDGHGNLWAGRPSAFPPVRQFHDEPALFQQRDLADKAVGILGSPGKRFEQPPRFQEPAHKRAFLRCGAHRLQQ
jgi:hypothetical protein